MQWKYSDWWLLIFLVTQEEISTSSSQTIHGFQQFNLFERRTALDNVKEGLVVVKTIGRRSDWNYSEELAIHPFSIVNSIIRASLVRGQNNGSCPSHENRLTFEEPTSALDPELVGEVERSIANAAKSGQTMVLASHGMSFVARVADKVCSWIKGRLLNLEHRMRLITILKKNEQKSSFC